MAVRPRGKAAPSKAAPPEGPLTLADLAKRVSAPQEVLEAVLPVATAHVEEYAPRAPIGVRNEAITRFCGYLAASGNSTVRKTNTGGIDLEFVVNHAPMFRNSGAAALLAPWRVRRAGVV